MDVRLAITGFGNVGQGLAFLLTEREAQFERQYGVRLSIVGVTDRTGAAVDPGGLDPASVLEAKSRGGVASHASGHAGLAGSEFLDACDAQVLVEAASTNFEDAEPGWTYVREAMARGMHIVLASKGSLALHWSDLMREAQSRGLHVLFSATVGAPVPGLQMAERVLVGSDITSFEGILNGTTHQILTAMAQGASYEEGVRQAQEMGIAETDPTLDVDGWDAAAKVAIMANAVFGTSMGIGDVDRQGIREVTPEDIRAAAADGETIKLIGRASAEESGVRATVAPERRQRNDPLGRLGGDAMGIVFHAEPLGHLAATFESAGHGGGIVTAMTCIRDILNLARDLGWAKTPER